jgi:hypothetical protein
MKFSLTVSALLVGYTAAWSTPMTMKAAGGTGE